MHTESVLTLLKTLQNQICAALEQEDGEAKRWSKKMAKPNLCMKHGRENWVSAKPAY